MEICPSCGHQRSDATSARDQIALMFRAGGVPLSNGELTMAVALKRYGGVVSEKRLIDALYGDDPNGGPLNTRNVMKVFLHRLRKKIDRGGIPWRIDNVWGHGWVLRSEDPKVHKKAIASLAVTVGFSLLLAHPMMALAQRICTEADSIPPGLAKNYGEHRVSEAMTAENKLLERYENPATGTWTLVIYENGARACVVSHGTGWYEKEVSTDPEA